MTGSVGFELVESSFSSATFEEMAIAITDSCSTLESHQNNLSLYTARCHHISPPHHLQTNSLTVPIGYSLMVVFEDILAHSLIQQES